MSRQLRCRELVLLGPRKPRGRQERRGEEAGRAWPRPDKEDGFLERGFKSMCSSELPLSDGAARVFWFSSADV